jgi:beta-glucanase (GH16 family)
MYGRFDIRAKLPSGQGIWPAIWMLPTDDKYGDWASCGEIDIMEFKGHEPRKLHTTLHFGSRWPNNRFNTNVFETKKDLTLDFHTYSLDWRKEKITWFLDDQEVYSTSRWESDQGPYPAPFDQRFHLLLNVAVGGGFGGPVAESTPFPAQMLIDFIRVYK